MEIHVVKEKTDGINKFEQVEWPIADKEHYGISNPDFTVFPFYLSLHRVQPAFPTTNPSALSRELSSDHAERHSRNTATASSLSRLR